MDNKLRYIQIIVGIILIILISFYIFFRYLKPSMNFSETASSPTTTNQAVNYQVNVFQLKNVDNADFSFLIPEYFDKIEYNFQKSEGDFYSQDREYAINISSSQSQVEFDIEVTKINEKNIELWEKNECQSPEYCKDYDTKVLVKDEFDEHYTYSYSATNWENIRNKNLVFSIRSPYRQGVTGEASIVQNYIIHTLKFKNSED